MGAASSAAKPSPVTSDVVTAPDGTHDVKWHAVDEAEALAHAQTTVTGGLSDAEVAARRTRYGPNAMTPGTQRTLLRKIWDQVNNSLIWLLIASAVIEAIFQSWADFILIVAVIVINVLIGLVQEGKAEKAAAAIKAMLAPTATVVRGGSRVGVPAEDVVPGDVVFIQSGDRVPADLRLIEIASLQVQEAMLTGESLPVLKSRAAVHEGAQLGDRTCLAYGGTLVVYGQATGVVVATGNAAELGRINAMVSGVESASTPLLDALEVFGRWLAALTVALALVAFLVAYLARDLAAKEAFSTAVGVAVAIIPEGLPAVTTITLALGVQHMARQAAIIRQLPAVETLGALTVICSDKTGTLTKNEMTVVSVRTAAGAHAVTGSGYGPEAGTICGVVATPPSTGGDAAPVAPMPGGDGALAGDGDVTAAPPLDELSRARLLALLLPGVLANDASLRRKGVPAAPTSLGAPGSAAAIPAASTDAIVEVGPPPPDLVGAAHAQMLTATPDAVGVFPAMPSWQMTGDPTEGALLTLGAKAGHNLAAVTSAHPRVSIIPFESDYKFMAVAVDLEVPGEAGKHVRTVLLKGAYDIVISRCATQAAGGDAWTGEPIDRAYWLAAASEYSKRGMRVLALAQYAIPSTQDTIAVADVLEGEPRMQLNCLVAIVDPPRQEAADAVLECTQARIGVKMITGDHPDTARTIGDWVNIHTAEVLTGAAMQAMDDATLEAHVEGCNIYARASPEHKLRIVRALQKHGHIVAMTGDGVNDAPALKQANVGVAMGITGTEVAKEAAKMILADDNFATIVKAVREGRGVYDNLRKILVFSLPTNGAQGFSILVALIIGMPVPLTPIQVLTVNMLTSVTLGIVLALEPPELDVMTRPPRQADKPLVDEFLAWRTLLVTTLIVTVMLGNEQWTLVTGGSLAQGRATAMATLVIAQALYAVNCRFLTRSSLPPREWFVNKWLTVAVAVNAAVLVFLMYVPGVQDVWDMDGISGLAWLRVLGLSAAVFLTVEGEKLAGPRFIWPVVLPPFVWLRAHTPSLRSWLARTLLPMASSAHGVPQAGSGAEGLAESPPGPPIELVQPVAEGVPVGHPPGSPMAGIEASPLSQRAASARSLAAAGGAQSRSGRDLVRHPSARSIELMNEISRHNSSRRVMDKDWAVSALNGAEALPAIVEAPLLQPHRVVGRVGEEEALSAEPLSGGVVGGAGVETQRSGSGPLSGREG